MQPIAAPTAVNGTLFGTTFGKGTDYGTIYDLPPGRRLRVLHKFDGPDGKQLSTSLLWSHGLLYGTTQVGGAHGLGTAFELNP